MKKILFWILTFLWIWLSFCSADSWSITFDCITQPAEYCQYSWSDYYNFPEYYLNETISNYCFESDIEFIIEFYNGSDFVSYLQWTNFCFDWDFNRIAFISMKFSVPYPIYPTLYYYEDSNSSEPSCESKYITVYYNSWNSTSIECDWVQAIEIQWLSTITSTNTFTPYYNISYTDEDNQKLIESYSKDILYLENWQFKKTYTWNNDWILSVQWNNSEDQFSWYVPVFDVTWSTQPIDTEYNMFNNFTDNSLKVLLSNIPSFFQYVLIFSIILMIIWIVKVFKRKK